MKNTKTPLTIFCFAWVMLLFLSITHWDVLKSFQMQELWETIKDCGIGDVIEWNAGYFLFFCLMVIFFVLCLRYNRKHCLRRGKAFRDEGQRSAEYHDPAYSALPGNIYCQTSTEND
jgi:hypothetical protein